MSIHRKWSRLALVGLVTMGCTVFLYSNQQSVILSAETIAHSSIEDTKENTRESLSTTNSELSVITSTEESIAFEGISTEQSPIPETTSTEEVTEAAVQALEETSATVSQEQGASIVKEQPLQASLPVEKVEEHFQFSVTRNQTTEEFIETIRADAQRIAWQEELYASVMIAQAILETGSGNSQLGQPPSHNLFGIKGSYQGKQVRFDTQEDKGNGQLYTISSAFRQYPSYKESLEDYARLLKQGLSGNPAYYQGVWKSHAISYQEATRFLTGRYATDTSYDKKLNALIETYGLAEYDLAAGNNQTEPVVEKEKNERTETAILPVEPSNSYSDDKVITRKSLQKQGIRKTIRLTQVPARKIKANQAVK